MLESRWVHAGGYCLHARVAETAGADRPAVVLVHGLGVSSRYMIRLAEHLAPDVRVYAPDLPGFGKSAPDAPVLTVPEHADVLAAWMDAAGLRRAVLLGNSLGCQLVTALGVRRPDLLAAAVLVGPTADPAGRNIPRLLARAAVDAFREHPALLPIITYDYLKAGVRRTFRTLRLLVRDPVEERLPHVTAPTLVVRGSRDAIVPAAWAQEMVRLLPRGRLVTIPGGAHAVHFGKAETLAEIVKQFMGLRIWDCGMRIGC